MGSARLEKQYWDWALDSAVLEQYWDWAVQQFKDRDSTETQCQI